MSEPRVGPLEAEVLAVLSKAPLTRSQVEGLLTTQGGSSTLARLETKGLVYRQEGRNFFEGDLWSPSSAGFQWLQEHPQVVLIHARGR